MIHYISRLVPLAFVLAFVSVAGAQPQPQGSLQFIAGFPQGGFSQNVESVGYGANLFGGIGIGRTPIVIGVEGGFLIYGYERRSEPFSTTIPDVRVDVTTSNNIALGHLVLRLQPPTGAVRPFVDGLVGLKYLFTETSIENQRHRSDAPIASSTNFDDVAFSYGAGGGLNIRVFSGTMGEMRRPGELSIGLGIRYLFGGEAEYLKKGSIRRENGDVSFDVERSQTALLVPHIGVVARF
jgi:hypothetical protein